MVDIVSCLKYSSSFASSISLHPPKPPNVQTAQLKATLSRRLFLNYRFLQLKPELSRESNPESHASQCMTFVLGRSSELENDVQVAIEGVAVGVG